MKNIFVPFLLIVVIFAQLLSAQERKFTHADSLRGGLSKERTWWDLTYYY
jgi:hypothetical protein